MMQKNNALVGATADNSCVVEESELLKVARQHFGAQQCHAEQCNICVRIERLP